MEKPSYQRPVNDSCQGIYTQRTEFEGHQPISANLSPQRRRKDIFRGFGIKTNQIPSHK